MIKLAIGAAHLLPQYPFSIKTDTTIFWFSAGANAINFEWSVNCFFSSSIKMKFSLKDNINIIKKVKAERKKIVFTNGCFDLLHVGHIRYPVSYTHLTLPTT